MVKSGMRAALVGPEQMLMLNDKPHIMPLMGLRARCRALILSPTVDALILVVQDNEFIQSGLPFDWITSLKDPEGRLTSFIEKSDIDK